ncbi:MAG: PspC domain-containing protein [Vulcanibacillus sp.]
MKRLTKSTNKIFDGVLGGFSEYFEIDPVWIRIGYVILALANFWIALFIYIAAAIIIPKGDLTFTDVTEVTEVKVVNSSKVNLLFGFGLILIGILFLLNQLLHIDLWRYLYSIYINSKYYVWAVFLIVLGLLIIVKERK